MKKAVKIILIIVAALIVAVYAAGVIYAHHVFLPNTFINDQDVGLETADDAKEMLLPKNTDFEIAELDGKESIPLSDFDYNLTFTTSLDDVIAAQNHFAWPISLFKATNLSNTLQISYDENLLKEKVRSLDAFDEKKVVKPSDAYIDIDDAGHYSIIPEVEGNEIDFSKAFSVINDAVSGGAFDADIVESGCYLKPSVYSDDEKLTSDLKFIKAIGEETITIDLTGATAELDPYALMSLASVDANDEIIINEDALWTYVCDLANEYNTYLSKREFTTHSGQVITVGGNKTEKVGIDTYGFLMNETVTSNILRNSILSKQSQTITPAWDVPALTRYDVNGDIGSTYIELSLTEQHLWYYQNGALFYDADVVTGLDTDARRTPWGVFRIYEKDKDCTLKGEMAGERWNTHVDYWLSVTWTGCGIHDATWQPTFGGERYKTNGSHGCINVSLETAKTLYENVAVDTPIIIY